MNGIIEQTQNQQLQQSQNQFPTISQQNLTPQTQKRSQVYQQFDPTKAMQQNFSIQLAQQRHQSQYTTLRQKFGQNLSNSFYQYGSKITKTANNNKNMRKLMSADSTYVYSNSNHQQQSFSQQQNNNSLLDSVNQLQFFMKQNGQNKHQKIQSAVRTVKKLQSVPWVYDTGNAYSSIQQNKQSIFKSPLQKRLAGAVSKKFNSIGRINHYSNTPDARINTSSGVSTRNFFDKNISIQDMNNNTILSDKGNTTKAQTNNWQQIQQQSHQQQQPQLSQHQSNFLQQQQKQIQVINENTTSSKETTATSNKTNTQTKSGMMVISSGVTQNALKDVLQGLKNQKLDKDWTTKEATLTIKEHLFYGDLQKQEQKTTTKQSSNKQLEPSSSHKKINQQQMHDGNTLTIRKKSKKQIKKQGSKHNEQLPQLSNFLNNHNQGQVGSNQITGEVEEEDEFACEATIAAPQLAHQKVSVEYKTNLPKKQSKQHEKRDLLDLLVNKKLLELYGTNKSNNNSIIQNSKIAFSNSDMKMDQKNRQSQSQAPQNTNQIGGMGQRKSLYGKQVQIIKEVDRDPELIVEKKHQNLFNVNKHRHWNDLIFAEDSNKIVWPRLCQAFQDFYKIDKLKLSLMASQFQHVIFEDEVGINNQGNTFDEMSRKIYEKAQRLKDSNYNNRFEDKIKYLLLERSDKYHNIMSLQPLAMGAEAAVYRIKSYDRKELVAKCTLVDIKNVNKSEKQQKKAHQQFLHIIQETQLLALIKHPDYVCRIEDEFITFDRQTEIIKEYVVVLEKANHSLSDILNIWNDRDIPNPANEHYCDEKLLYIIYRTMEALEYLHQQEVYFGDMKPQNLLIFKDYMVKIGDFGISIKRDPYRQDSYQLRGITEYYCTIETIFAFSNSQNFTFDGLMKLDKDSLMLTIFKCLVSIQSFGKRNLYVEEIYEDLTKMTIKDTLEKWAEIFKTNSQILQNLGRQFIKERKYEAMVKAYQLSKYCNIVFPPPPPIKNTDGQLEFQLNKWRNLDLPNINFVKDKKSGRIKQLNQNIEFKKIFMDCATFYKFPSPKLSYYEEETRKREYLYLLRSEIKELIISDFYEKDLENVKLTKPKLEELIDNFCIDSRAYLLGLELKDEIPFDEAKIKMLMNKVYESQNFNNNEIYDYQKLSLENQMRMSYIKFYFRALDLKKYDTGIARILIINIKPPTVLHPQALNYHRINKRARIALKINERKELQDITDLQQFYEKYTQQMKNLGKHDAQDLEQETFYHQNRSENLQNDEIQTKHQLRMIKMQQKPEVQYDIDVGQEYYPEYKFIIKYTKILEYFKSEQYYECYKESAAVLESWELVEFNKREMYLSEVNQKAAQCLIKLKELKQIPKEMLDLTEEEYQALVVQYYKYYSFSSDVTLAKYIQYLKITGDLDELIISFRRVIQIRKEQTQQTTDLHRIEPKLLELDELQKKFEYFVRYWLKWSKNDAIQTLMMLPDPFTTDFNHMLDSIVQKFQQKLKQTQESISLQGHKDLQKATKQKQLKQDQKEKQQQKQLKR
eukprot:403339088